MKRHLHVLYVSVALPFIAFGCKSANVNPRKAKTNTGYVDFYSRSDAQLSWDVRKSKATGHFKKVFWNVKPVPDDVLRVAFSPGQYRFRVTFLNRVTTKPAEVEAKVENGKITPIEATLTEAGSTFVQSKETSRGNTFYGRAGRRTKINSEETVRYDISAIAEEPVPYQPRQQMPYAR